MAGAGAGPLQRTLVAAGWGAKAILVFVLAVLMAVPGLFVFGLVLDRQHRAEQVTDQVSAMQGGPQQLLGPMLIAPYTAPQSPATDASGATHPQPPQTGWYVVSPEQGTASVRLAAKNLHRSIFNVPVYEADAVLDAHFGPPPATPNLPAGASVDWQAARIVVGFTDLRGAKTDVAEYVGFDWAFAGAATATVLLMGLYASAAFKSRARRAGAGGVRGGLRPHLPADAARGLRPAGRLDRQLPRPRRRHVPDPRSRLVRRQAGGEGAWGPRDVDKPGGGGLGPSHLRRGTAWSS